MLFKRLAFKKFFNSTRKSKNVDTSARVPPKTAKVEGGPKDGLEHRGAAACMCRHNHHRPCHGETVSPNYASRTPMMCIPCQKTLAKNKQAQDASLTHYFREKIEPTIHTYRQASGVRCSCCKRIPTHSSKVYYGNIYCEPCLYKLILNQQLENPLHYCNAKSNNRENSVNKVEFIGNADNLLPKHLEPNMNSSWIEDRTSGSPRVDYEMNSGFAGASDSVLPPAEPQPASTRYKKRV